MLVLEANFVASTSLVLASASFSASWNKALALVYLGLVALINLCLIHSMNKHVNGPKRHCQRLLTVAGCCGLLARNLQKEQR